MELKVLFKFGEGREDSSHSVIHELEIFFPNHVFLTLLFFWLVNVKMISTLYCTTFRHFQLYKYTHTASQCINSCEPINQWCSVPGLKEVLCV